MAIEIRELTIKTNVISQKKTTHFGGLFDRRNPYYEKIKSTIVQECLAEIMEKLEDKRGR